jgi:hypothetical protein
MQSEKDEVSLQTFDVCVETSEQIATATSEGAGNKPEAEIECKYP